MFSKFYPDRFQRALRNYGNISFSILISFLYFSFVNIWIWNSGGSIILLKLDEMIFPWNENWDFLIEKRDKFQTENPHGVMLYKAVHHKSWFQWAFNMQTSKVTLKLSHDFILKLLLNSSYLPFPKVTYFPPDSEPWNCIEKSITKNRDGISCRLHDFMEKLNLC